MSGHTILCIDDDAYVREVVKRMLDDAGHRCDTASDAYEARRLLSVHRYSVILCDVGLPGESGLDLLADLARRPDVAAVMVTAENDPVIADRALELGAYGFLAKPFVSNDLLIAISGAVRRHSRDELREAELRRAYQETVARLGRAMGFHDVETGEHVERVGESAEAIARELALPRATCERLRLASPLHDLGKIAVSQAILRKPGALSHLERRSMERHTEVGYELLRGSGNALLDLAATVAWTHHESWDGSGYPRRLQGEEIPLAGRIVAVADVFDALTSDRVYRKAFSVEEATQMMREQRGHHFDPVLLDAFMEVLGQTGPDAREQLRSEDRKSVV